MSNSDASRSTQFEVVYWPTERVCADYDTREAAEAAVAWYTRTYGPFEDDRIGIREVANHD